MMVVWVGGVPCLPGGVNPTPLRFVSQRDGLRPGLTPPSRHGGTQVRKRCRGIASPGESQELMVQAGRAQGRSGAMPARSSMIMAMNAWGSWKPRALVRIRPMAALTDSAIPLVRRHSMVASMEAR